jgi:hypothetical protein
MTTILMALLSTDPRCARPSLRPNPSAITVVQVTDNHATPGPATDLDLDAVVARGWAERADFTDAGR